MARPEKVAKVDEVSAQFTGAAATLLTHYRGLSVTEISDLRVRLRAAGAEMKVVKNTLTRRAASKAGLDGLEEMLVGPTGLIFCADDPVGPAKVLRDFAKDHPDLVVRGGYLDGEVLDEVAAIKLADLSSREELLEQLAGLMYGALANTARLLNALPEKQAQLMKALIDAGGAPGAPTDVAETADAAPEADASEEAPEADASAEEAPEEPTAEAGDTASADDGDAADATEDETTDGS